MLLRRQEDLYGLPAGKPGGSQAGYPGCLEGTGSGLQTVKTSEGTVHEGEAIFGGLEEERVVVAAESPVEGGESLRSELVMGVLCGIDVALFDSVSPRSHQKV